MTARKTYRIGEVAAMLSLKPSVLRFWETEFPQIEITRTEKGQRVYTESNVALLRRIQQLLHEQGMTIEGARRILEGSAVMDENAPEKILPVPDPAFMNMLRRDLEEIRAILINGESGS